MIVKSQERKWGWKDIVNGERLTTSVVPVNCFEEDDNPFSATKANIETAFSVD